MILRELAAFAKGSSPNADVRKLRGGGGYRLRIGRWRVLFARVNGQIVVYRVLDRKNAYR